jgi:hypothetical protein
MALFTLVFHARPSVREQMAIFTSYVIFAPVADHGRAVQVDSVKTCVESAHGFSA